MATILEFDRVTVRFDRGPQFASEVLNEVSFRLEDGETRVLMGAAGSGKSVLMKTALGLIAPDEGHVSLFDQDLTGLSESKMFPLRIRAGMVFQEGALFDSLTVAENVAYIFQEERSLPEEQEKSKVREALQFVELDGTQDLMPSELSGGMRRRVAIARAFVGGPPLMLYDSPTAGLDPVTAHRIMSLVVKLRDVQHVTAVLITHRIQDAHLLATTGSESARTTFMVLREGEVVFDGDERELFAARDSYVRKFIET